MKINSKDWWEGYFKENSWKMNNGDEQSTFFMKILLENLSPELKQEILDNKYSICDMGCAEGDGTSLLKETFVENVICGVDISTTAIQQANNKYPQINFLVDNIDEINKCWDVVICSNVLEHFENPQIILEKLMNLNNHYLIIMVPFKEEILDPSHFYRFEDEDFMLLPKGYDIVEKKKIDTSKLNPTYWNGQQLLVVIKNLLSEQISIQNKQEIIPNRQVWDKVSEAYDVNISEEEMSLASEILEIMLSMGIKKGSKIIELGCGSGHLSACLAKEGYDVTLLDFSSVALDKAKQTFEKYHLTGTFIEGDILELSDTSTEYDLVWNSGVMEHFDDINLKTVFLSIKKILGLNNSKFLFLVPNPKSISYLLMRYNLYSQQKWEYGFEYLRTNYLEIAETAGLAGKILGYVSGSISKWHFESTFSHDPNRNMYSHMMDNNLLPDNEKYLIAYVVSNVKENSKAYIQERNEGELLFKQSDIQLEKYFQVNAELFGKNKENQIIKEKIDKLDYEVNLLREELEQKNSILQKNAEELERLEKQSQELEEQSHELEKYMLMNTQLKEEITCYKDDNKRLQVLIEKEIEKNKRVKEQNTYYITEIEDILNYKNLSRMFYLHAIFGKYKHDNFKQKLKVITKFFLRIFGIRKNFYVDEYRADFRILNFLQCIKHNYILLSSQSEEMNKKNTNSIECYELIEDNKIKQKVGHQLDNIIERLPKVSILMPVYNHADFVEESIQSILFQTYSNWELIILDDGSTDNLLEILESYSNDPRIRLYTQDNQRLPNGLSNLHELANGEYITWTSADNIMEREMIYELVNYLVTYPKVDMVYADVMVIDENGDKLNVGYRQYNSDLNNPEIIRLPRVPECLNKENDNFINACFMYKKSISDVLNGEYSADLEGLEDYDYWLKIQKIGNIQHIKNNKPLYRYRVHKNTMSEELLQNQANEHMERAKKLIQYDLCRERYVNQLWNIGCITSNSRGIELFEILTKNGYIKSDSQKTINIIDESQISDLKPSEIGILVENENYILYRNDDKAFNTIKIETGIEVNILSKKARYTHIKGLYWEYPAKFLGYVVIGAHCDMSNIDIDKMIEYVKKNTNILFALAAYPNTEDKKNIEYIKKECDNFIYVGEKEIGECYYYYASWNMMFLPPQKKYCYEDIMHNVLLAWNIGRWILVERLDKGVSFPFVTSYNYKERELGLLDVIDMNEYEEILEDYISYFSKEYRLKMLIRYLNGFTIKNAGNRPNFGEIKKTRQEPKKIEYMIPKFKKMDSGEYIAILVDSLDKGGLEQVVKFLAESLRKRNANIRILCTVSGGVIAKKLEDSGFEVQIFYNDEKKFKKYLKENPPLLVNTHYTKKFIDIVYKFNIPIIEVIHNMYVYLNEKDWERERINERYFSKFIAVSQLVKDIYVKKHGNVSSDKITVIGNSANVERIRYNSRNLLRKKLGIPNDAIVFINVSSIDGRKNQLGLMSAFEDVYSTSDHNIYLIFVGNILSEFYYNLILERKQQSISKNNVIILEYYDEIGSLLNMSDVFILDSYFEGWSIAATEAVFAGIPLIHSDCGSGKELISNGENGILVSNPENNIDDISVEQLMRDINRNVADNNNEVVQAMNKMIQDIDFWKSKREEIKFYSYTKFNEQKMIDQYVYEMERLIEKEKNK